MFEGDVTMHIDGWEPWVRVLVPSDIAAIAKDLSDLTDNELRSWLEDSVPSERDTDVLYVVGYLQKARVFVSGLAAAGRGLVYMIG